MEEADCLNGEPPLKKFKVMKKCIFDLLDIQSRERLELKRRFCAHVPVIYRLWLQNSSNFKLVSHHGTLFGAQCKEREFLEENPYGKSLISEVKTEDVDLKFLTRVKE